MKIRENMFDEIEMEDYKISVLDSIEEVQAKGITDIDDLSKADKDYYQRMLDVNGCIALVLTHQEDGKTNSAALLILAEEEDGRLWVERLELHDDYRARGVSDVVMEIMKQIGNSNDFRRILVDLEIEDEDGLYFYTTLGFEEAGILQSYYPDDSSARIMSIALK